MINDPYQILGISRDASQDEIKKAYRKKAKEYHPDLHPDDPDATRKMNEVNEAYDMLTNPEKYASRRAQQQGGGQNDGYGGAYQQQERRQSYTGYRGAGGWSSDFGGFGFDFDDIFGFGQAGARPAAPTEMSGDSPDIRAVIRDINSQQYQAAASRLAQIPSTDRNGRWYYLSSLANMGLGSEMQALEQIRRAIQMEPNNTVYRQVYQQLRQTAQAYQRTASESGFHTSTGEAQKCCMGLCAVQLFCTFCRCI